MLKLLPHQIRILDQQAKTSFLDGLTLALSDLDGAFLPRFPLEIRHAIVTNLVGRAISAGAISQRSVTVWCGLMCGVAPNLSTDPAVRAWVARTGTDTDSAIASLADCLSPVDLRRIELARQDLPLFVPANEDNAPLEHRVAIALPLVLWDRVSEASALRRASECVRAAEKLGLGGVNDAPVALAVMGGLYGPDLWHQDWTRDLRDTSTPAATRLAMLRARIMVDHGRWA